MMIFVLFKIGSSSSYKTLSDGQRHQHEHSAEQRHSNANREQKAFHRAAARDIVDFSELFKTVKVHGCSNLLFYFFDNAAEVKRAAMITRPAGLIRGPAANRVR